ncbi:outer envelope membrane protein 7 [Oryza brachyantha]|uniref:outer envelope membrane protein 7 n=1 Tax=Oryza brachyantha TaxID=4533 RepID=UPI001ADBE279|nr:outer envelope membrane protein 7 [Oryza brachyantha]
MARGEGGGQREGSALKTAVVVTGGLVLAWFTMESAFKPFLDRLRGALTRSTDPAPRDPDEEPAAPPAAAEGAEEGEKKGEDKEVELEEKGEGDAKAE